MAHQMLGLRWTIDRRRLARGGRATACLALAFPALVVLCAFLVAGPAWWLVALVAGLLALSLVRPGWGWLALIAISPFGDLLGRSGGFLFGLTEPLVLAFLAGWLVREALRAPRDGEPALPTTSRLPLALAGLFGLAVVASMTVHLIVVQVSSAFPLDFARYVWRFVWHDYYRSVETLRVIRGAAFMLEGVGLFVATLYLTVGARRLAYSGTGVFAGAMAAVAAVNLVHAWPSLRLAAAPGNYSGLMALRLSYVFPDVNAAGSYFVMALFVATGLALSSRRAGVWWGAALLAIVGLWLSGSRTAFAAAPVGALYLVAAALIAASSRALRAALPGALIVAVAASLYVLGGPRSTTRNLSSGFEIRVEMASTAVRMLRAHPVFGVGPGLYYELSNGYLSPRWRAVFGRENAHNNFLQVLAELGVVGFALFLSLLAAVLGSVRVAGRSRSRDTEPRVLALGGALVAFLATWAAGHPMLTAAVSLAFWLVLALLATAAQEVQARPTRAGWRRGRVIVAATALAIVCLVPLRAEYRLAGADLSRSGRGFSQWHIAPDGVRYRWLPERGVLYVPASAAVVAIPLRSPGGAATVRVLVDGERAAQAVVAGGWREVEVELSEDQGWDYAPVEVRVISMVPFIRATSESASPRVQVGLPRILRSRVR